MQGKLTTDCDGSVEHEKWQEPAGTLSVALTAYKGGRTPVFQQTRTGLQHTENRSAVDLCAPTLFQLPFAKQQLKTTEKKYTE